ncbi:MAG: T9SS type A sorting domain-containing protein [Tannerellaceae bacterium]|jgi:hypothetical protein|nr:T9SS type A sorting domain-containing protein [Tannerellaceae bacterium]
MKRLFILFLLFALHSHRVPAQHSFAKWTIHFSYFSTDMVEESPQKVYAVAEGALFSYGKEDRSIETYDKKNGLSDCEIRFIRYNKQTKSLLIIYRNGHIDLLKENGIVNIPDLYTNTSIRNKEVNAVFIHNEYAYISTAFGIIALDMNREEIPETYHLSVNTTSCCIIGQSIYAATADGILQGEMTDNLLDRNNWKTYALSTSLFDTKAVNDLFVFDGTLCFFVKNRGIYYMNNQTATTLLSNNTLSAVKLTNDRLIAIAPSRFYLFPNIKDYDLVTDISINDISSYTNDTYWIAEGSNGLKQIAKGSTGAYGTITESILLNGPRINSPYKMICTPSKLYVIAGGKTASGVRFGLSGMLMMYDYEKWTFIDHTPAMEAFGMQIRDYLSIAIHPDDPENLFISSFGEGVVEFKNNLPVQLYNYKNSALQTILKDNLHYHFIDGLCYDKQGNLWMTNSEVSHAIKVLDKEGQWHSLFVESLDTKYTINDILITADNYKWINIPRVTSGIAILDDKGTLDDPDDTSVFYNSFKDTDGNDFSSTGYTCMAEDKNNYVWVGTNRGPVCFMNPSRAFDTSNFRCSRIKLTNDEGSLYYFLDNVRITCITVDSGNRKWIGTESNGVYVLNESNDGIVYEFNTTNSPLLSDHIYSIATNNQTGEVFIGTDKGLVSYKGDATEGKPDFSDVYVFPNPVRPEFDEHVTITGLMDNTQVKITDLNGNIIYQTKSTGGQVTWNVRNRSGNRVASGVYLVLGATENSSESVVTKIAVVN